MVLYVITGVLVVILGVVTVVMATVGVMGLAGIVHIARCGECGHLTVAADGAPPASCSVCRHPHLVHPMATLAHVHVPRSH